jgi:hypothetical protein
MSDAYAYWKAKVRGEDASAYILPTMYSGTYEDPQPGAYKVRLAKGGPKVPMRIWLTKDGAATAVWSEGCELTGTIDGTPMPAKAIAERWIWAEAVSKADLDHYNTHKLWPGEIGHNSGDLTLAEKIKDAIENAPKGNPTDKKSADIASNYRDKLNALAKEADDERDAKVRPHLEAQRAINAEYKPLIDSAKKAADALRDGLTVWMREQEAKAKAIADAARKAAEEAAKAHGMEDVPLPLPEPPKVQAGGQRGRKAGLRTVTKYECHDIAAVMEALKDNAELQAAAVEIARKLMKAGANIPGMQVVVERHAA